MKRSMKLLFSLLLLLSVQSVLATTFYISPSGDDETGNGSSARPWKSLFKATTLVITPGDIIHVNKGIYMENRQSIVAPGVSIEGEGETSIIKSMLHENYTAMVALLSLTEGEKGNQHISNIKFDGQNLSTFWCIYIAGRSNVSIHDITAVDFKEAAVIFSGRIDNVEEPPAIYATGNSFYNNTILNCASFDGWGRGCVGIGGQDGMLIYGNTITQNQRPPGANGWCIKAQNAGYTKGCKIYNNHLTRAQTNGFDWDFAIEMFNQSGMEIYGNTMQGAIDLNYQTKGDYAYSVWIHDNIIARPALLSFIETGVTLEFSTENAIIENNTFKNLGVAISFTPRESNDISQVRIENNRCENIGVAGSHLGFAIRIGEDGKSLYSVSNLLIDKNQFLGSASTKPYWGIGILGASKVSKVQIIDNTLENFSAGCIVASPASVIDDMVIEKNQLSSNGYGNKPAFSNGYPIKYSFKNNTSSHPVIFSLANLKMNIIRPLYYALKSINMLVCIIFLAAFVSFWLCRKESIYAFPMALFTIVSNILLNFDQELFGDLAVSCIFLFITGYGWFSWSRRDKKNHRIVRITSSSKKDGIIQLSAFTVAFLILLFCRLQYKKDFAITPVMALDTFVDAGIMVALGLAAQKKVESWYWWLITATVGIMLFFIKNYLLFSFLLLAVVFILIVGLKAWKRRRRSRRKY